MNPLIGDYGTVRTGGLAAKLIRFGTRSPVNHAFVYIGGGQIVEAQPGGAAISQLSAYTNVQWDKRIDSSDVGRDIAKAALGMVGTPYNWLDIAALTFACYGMRNRWIDRRIERDDRLICSQLVDKAYQLAGVQLFDDGRLPGEVTPGDLYDLTG